jgi:hypothetical protein
MGGTERGDEAVETQEQLNATHRCDRCGAQAYLRVEMPGTGLELLWCGHHADEHRAKLEELASQGAGLLDELDKIQRRPIAR